MRLYENGPWLSAPASHTVVVRIQGFQLEKLRKAFPGKSVSYAVRSCIAWYLEKNCNT